METRTSPRRPRLTARSLGVLGTLGSAALFAALPSGAASVGSGAGGSSSGFLGGAVRVVIDPGHGGTDPGAIGNGIVEKEINLAVGLRLRELLELDTLDTNGGGEWEVLMTRDNDASVSLTARSNLANNWGADRFISIHHNAFSMSSANGTETFSFADGTISANLRDRIQEELLIALGLLDRGSKTANFSVLRETLMPAALSEGGFLTNPGDAAVLSSPDAVDRSARAHFFGLQRHYGLQPYLPTDGPTTYCVAKLASPGCIPEITSSGTPSLSNSDFIVACDRVVSQQFGLMIWSRQAAAIPLFGATLCVGGTIRRTPVQFSFGLGNGNCSGRLELSLDSAFMQSSGFQAGEDIFAQWWFRDPFYFPNDPVGLSNGLRFTVLP
ncbi:MAG: N-acetylmuramoyl-L-alanine amidase [Planctomycetota bacterium]|jgi:N-acetylmuramoyl-L-alanine amidase